MDGYGSIPTLDFTTDSEGNVQYSNNPATTGTTTGGTTTPAPTEGGTPWWQTLLAGLPGLVNSIFGNQPAIVQPPFYPISSTSNNNNNNNILLIGLLLVVVVYITTKGKR